MSFAAKRIRIVVTRMLLLFALIACQIPLTAALHAADDPLYLNDLIEEGLKNSPDILASQARTQAAGYRISQAKSLPDPMFMFGYQNEGFQRLTIGEAENAMGMSSLSQMFLFPGKRALKGEMAASDAESLAALSNGTKLRVTAQIKILYYDLFFAHKSIDILKDRAEFFSRIEDAAAARYASGMGSQQEALMAQTEKYMLLEKEEMQLQRIQALQGMLNTTVGRDVNSPLGRPLEPGYTPFSAGLEELVRMAYDHSPEVKSKKKMVEGAEAKVRMAKKEYYPDITIGASYFPRTQGMPDMWNLTATINLPIYYKTKQRQAVLEAQSGLSEAKREVQATELMLSSNVRDSFSMLQAADRLMRLYNEGLIQKASQDVQLAFSGYVTGKAEILTVITRIKNLLDFDILYWNQFAEREKAIARLHAFTGGELPQGPRHQQENNSSQGGTR
jgi:outer membrane protein TolC